MWWHLTAVLITSCYQQLHLWEKWKEVIKLGLFWCCSQSIMVLWDPFIIVKNPKTHEMHLMVQLEHYGSRVEIVAEKNSVKSIFKLILITFSAIWRHNLMFLFILLPLTFSAFSGWHFNFIENKLNLVCILLHCA